MIMMMALCIWLLPGSSARALVSSPIVGNLIERKLIKASL